MIIAKGMRGNSDIIPSKPKFSSTKLSDNWRNQANSIAYRVSKEYKDDHINDLQREIVTLITKSTSVQCQMYVEEYFNAGIAGFIKLVYKLSTI
jgi:hypothetical protein